MNMTFTELLEEYLKERNHVVFAQHPICPEMTILL